jgi:hypothetical protein
MDITDETLCRLTALVLADWADASVLQPLSPGKAGSRARAALSARAASRAVKRALRDIEEVDGTAT